MKKIGNWVFILFLSILIVPSGCFSGQEKCLKDCCKSKNEVELIRDDYSLTNHSIVDTSSSSNQLACTLTGFEKLERKESLKKEIFSQVKSIEELESGYLFRFADSNNFMIKIIDYITVEKECCPFFKYDIIIHPYNRGIELEVTGEEGSKDLITMLVEEIRNER